MTAGPPLPRYGSASLSDLLPSVAAVLGVPGYDNVLGLPSAGRICLLLVDGLGWNLLRRATEDAPLLGSLAEHASPITAGFPSTTATSLASIGTGLPPGSHGLLGYQVCIPTTRHLMNHLRWSKDVDPLSWQPNPTVFERAESHGVPAYHVSAGAFRDSGLTVAALRGARYVPAETAGDVVAGVEDAAGRDPCSLIYAYYADVDKTGHIRGCGSRAWHHQLAITDRVVERIAGVLDQDDLLVITGDHGMVDAPFDRRYDVDSLPALRDGVALLGGEPRARHVYTAAGADDDVLATWHEVLGADAWVVTRDQAIGEGWFGPVVPDGLRARIGDVVAAVATDTAIVATKAEANESALLGHHGSLTDDELQVPLLLARGGRAVTPDFVTPPG